MDKLENTSRQPGSNRGDHRLESGPCKEEPAAAIFTDDRKMEAVGRLAGGVAHELNNKLYVITGNAELAMEHLPLIPSLNLNLQEILNAAGQASDLIRQLLAFSCQQPVWPRIMDLNDIVADSLQQFDRNNIDLAWVPGSNVARVMMDSLQIRRLLYNLLGNACQAIGDTGRISIETGGAVFDRDFCRDNPGYTPGEYVCLAVRDDGCGMDQQTMDHMFDPFFSTREVGQGSGMGLAEVSGIVRQNNGIIAVSSEPGRGTVIKIYLPVYDSGR